MRAQLNGSVVFNHKQNAWNFLWVEDGKRRSKLIGHAKALPTREAALVAAEPLRRKLARLRPESVPTVRFLTEQYREEKMPERASTQRGYEAWLKNHILPKWGKYVISDVQARPVELWLQSLELSPKSKMHIREVLSSIWAYAIWRYALPDNNPMKHVRIKGGNRRTREIRSLTLQEFQTLRKSTEDPCMKAPISVAAGLGLRISEVLGLKWKDIDWLGKTVRIERGVVKQIVDEVKTANSAKTMATADEILQVLQQWKQASQFTNPEDWVFASPVKLGRQPLGYTFVWETLKALAQQCGIGHISSHCFRHSYRMWLDSVGTPVGVQQKLMRHADIRTTMNIYGDAATDDMRQAHAKVAQAAFM